MPAARIPADSSPRRAATCCGIVLAAGASTRMERPKALLEIEKGVPLAAHQSNRLLQAGCGDAVVVLGAKAREVAERLPGVALVLHADWALGRFSSLQAGLRARPGFGGYLILPVDTVGVRAETFSALIAQAAIQPAPAWRPRYQGRPGRTLWIRADLAAALEQEPASDVPIDRRLEPVTAWMDVDDPAILNNINTPADWAAFRSSREAR